MSTSPTVQDAAASPPSPTPQTDEYSKPSNTGTHPHPQSGGLKSYLRIFSYADSCGWTLNALALMGAIGAGAALPLMDLLFGKMLTTFNDLATGQSSPEEFRDSLNRFVLYFVYLFIGKFSLVYIWTLSISISALRTTKALRTAFLTRLLQQPISFFDASLGGSPVTHVTTNANLINSGTSEKLGFVLQGTATFVAAFITAFAVQWKLTLITICIAPAILIITTICSAFLVQAENAILRVDSRAGSLAEEVLASMKTVHAFNAFEALTGKYEAFAGEARRLGIRQSANMAILYAGEFFCAYAGYGLAFWQGIRMYARGEIDEPGAVVTVIFAVILAATSMTQIAPQIVQITRAASAAQFMWEVIDHEPSIDALSTLGKQPKTCRGEIQFSSIAFSYPTRPQVRVLEDFTLAVPANKTTALVGPSGSGKSTISALLERWYDPLEGGVLLDGLDIRELNVRWLRTSVRIVQQEPTLFNGTVFENVAYGLAGTEYINASREEQLERVIEACKAAYAHEFIEGLPEGYDTRVGERASVLSGGQKQRIAIARSIVSDPKVLILDEATSALDPRAEKIVQEALDNVSASRTTIVIAHKLSTIRKADQIVVLSKGRIIEKGTHDELNEAGGMYHRLIEAQDLGANKTTEVARREEQETEEDALVTNMPSVEAESPRDTSALELETDSIDSQSLLRCIAILVKERRELWMEFVIVVIACIVGGGSYPVLAFVFARSLDAFQIADTAEMIDQGEFYALMFFVIALVILVVYAILGWVTNIISTTVVYTYRMQIFRSYVTQDMTFYDQPSHTTGSLVSHLSTKPTSLQELLGFNIGIILIAVVNIVSSSILSIAVGWKLGLVVLAGAMTPITFCGYLRIRLETQLEKSTGDRFAESAALAGEAISAIRTVASLAIEPVILDRYKGILRGIARRSIRGLVWTTAWLALTQSLSLLSMALSFWYGGRLLSTGEYSSTKLYIVVIGAILSGEAAASFFMFTTSLTKARGACNYIFWLRSLVPSVRDGGLDDDHPSHSTPEKDQNHAASLELQDIEFRYPTRPNRTILTDLNIKVSPGQSIAFVGPSGHGKSSIIALLERYYNPSCGRITLDGTPVTTIPLQTYRTHLSLVQQEPILYDGSVLENITLGIPNPSSIPESEIHSACHQANAFDFISSLPNGLSTPCGARGSLFSGGQRQRIAIARALLRNPRLLLLDEATSALDTESERVVQAALESASVGRTTIAIAHRLSTVKGSDCIYVLVRGRIVESGTHEVLLARRGVYYQMCLGQALDGAG
ncbi:ABC transporter ATP-binding protein [Aspergillus brunneoviolaceus CBS 621.78]|uniref:ATP-binding cassette multidrug transport protein n=1 Tax=Aspergillus brunneoviolaceus CBS 621.78 TaxID=1450534 RepID=A0ACD1G8T9_9EURO|nr:ATP-binding cassette multidrug transport protein [Aspergillus brunneoviolaceus CBS 621.78]RAH45704.1 ATP-binding cassette multidrug transport protein [Aspergillus brunneoviolaceus CBS 621.78]